MGLLFQELEERQAKDSSPNDLQWCPAAYPDCREDYLEAAVIAWEVCEAVLKATGQEEALAYMPNTGKLKKEYLLLPEEIRSKGHCMIFVEN